ncbi:MAG: hypothetical protein ACOYZ6_07915 [Chloroflexota bacterium]
MATKNRMHLWIAGREWMIPSRKKPASGRDVLGVVKFPDGTSYVEIVNYDDRDKDWVTSNGLESVRVIYWCELPELPRKVRHAG